MCGSHDALTQVKQREWTTQVEQIRQAVEKERAEWEGKIAALEDRQLKKARRPPFSCPLWFNKQGLWHLWRIPG